MKTKITFLLFFLISTIGINAQSFVWAKGFGSGNANSEMGSGVTTDALGNVYTVGAFGDVVDFDPGPGTYTLATVPVIGALDIFISKLDAAGNFVWAKQMKNATGGANAGYGIAIDASGNVYTTGRFTNTVDFDPGPGTYTLSPASGFGVFISKLDAVGNFVWAKQFNGQGLSIALDGTGNVYTTGYTGGGDFDPGAGTYNLTSAGSDDAFISKLDASGNFVWAGLVGGSGTDRGNSIALDGSANVIITGRAESGDLDPGTGTFSVTTAGGADIFILKLNTSGNFLWAGLMGGGATDEGKGIATDATGNIYSTGFFGTLVADFDPGAGTFTMTSSGGDDIFISKLDASGNFVWAKKLSAANSDYGTSITVDGVGDVYSTGLYNGLGDFDPGPGTYTLSGTQDIYISKLDNNGNFLSAKKIGGSSIDEGRSIHVDNSCGVYLTGRYRNNVDFDPGPGTFSLTSVGGGQDEFFTMKLNCITTGIENLNFESNTISIYPNPSSGNFTLQLKEELNGTMMVTDVLGKEILKQELNGAQQIDFSIETKGLYFIRLEAEGKRMVKKVVVQ